ncbi:MAG: hypothetical protein ACI9C2_002305 [Gammaproteobacteria bacterium]|jgi:hypothetical protein
MNGKTVLIILLGLASAAIWAPQALATFRASQEPEVELPRADEVGNGAASQGTKTKPGPGPKSAALGIKPPTQPQLSPSMPPQQAALRESDSEPRGGPQIEQLLSVLRPFSGSKQSALGDLLETPPSWLTQDSQEMGASTDSDGIVVETQLDQQRLFDDERAQSALIGSFLDSAPLSAIVTGESGAWALLGGRIVRKGDVLLPNLLKIKSISKTGMVLSSPDGPIEVPLPAFQAYGPSSNQGPNEDLSEMPSPSDAPAADSLTSMPPS